jgi:hypothetical protein
MPDIEPVKVEIELDQLLRIREALDTAAENACELRLLVEERAGVPPRQRHQREIDAFQRDENIARELADSLRWLPAHALPLPSPNCPQQP